MLLAINHAHTPALDAVMTFASNRTVWFPAYALLIGWLIYVSSGAAGARACCRSFWYHLAPVGLADSITSRLFKPFFARPRPCHDGQLASLLHLPDGCGGQFGFLSSHAANSVCAGRISAARAARRPLSGPESGPCFFGPRCYPTAACTYYPTERAGGACIWAGGPSLPLAIQRLSLACWAPIFAATRRPPAAGLFGALLRLRALFRALWKVLLDATLEGVLISLPVGPKPRLLDALALRLRQAHGERPRYPS